jgi:hypothetical protein
MSPRDVREVRIVFDVSDDLRVATSDPEEGGEVVHSVGPSTRGTSPVEEIPYDRTAEPRPPPPPPLVDLYCRGPLAFSGLWGTHGGGPAFGLQFVGIRRSETGAGAEGEKLAPGTCAFRDRPLTSAEPTRLVVYGTRWDEFVEPGPVGAVPYNAQKLGGKIHQLARVEFALSHLSNLITRSDYVVALVVRNEGDWFTAHETELFSLRYIPFTE